MKSPALKPANVPEMASEYRFDYCKAKPSRFAVMLNLNVAWTAERFVGEAKVEKPKAKLSKGKKSAPVAKLPKRKAKTASKKPKAKKTTAKKKTDPKTQKEEIIQGEYLLTSRVG